MGIAFSQVSDSAPWKPRYGLGVVVFAGRLWVLGGTASAANGTQFNDVWSSEDGSEWRQELAAAPWSPRWNHATFAFGGKLWVIGGLASVDPLQNLNDIWSSPDGRNWTLEVPDAPWAARHVWAWTIHRDRMFLIGGATDGSHTYRDVLSSEDGRRWRREAVRDPWFCERKYHAAASCAGRLYVVAGVINDDSQPYGGRYLDDVWSSEDGEEWRCDASPAPWSGRAAPVLLACGDRLWLSGGELQSRLYGNDLWWTEDGVHWQREADEPPWPGRTICGSAVFRDKVWIMGGHHRDWPERVGHSLNDVWTCEVVP